MLLILERFQRGKKSDVISDWPDFGLRSLLKSASGSHAMKDLSDLFFRDQNEKAQMQGIPRTRHLFRKYNFCDSFTDPNDRSSTTSTRKTLVMIVQDIVLDSYMFLTDVNGVVTN